MKKQNEQWSEYLANKSVRPKLYNVTLRRKRDGSFEVCPRGVQMLNIVNEHRQDTVTVNARAFAKALRESGVAAK
jgi:hypothetical protein